MTSLLEFQLEGYRKTLAAARDRLAAATDDHTRDIEGKNVTRLEGLMRAKESEVRREAARSETAEPIHGESPHAKATAVWGEEANARTEKAPDLARTPREDPSGCEKVADAHKDKPEPQPLRCAEGFHEDPDYSGLCVYCGASLIAQIDNYASEHLDDLRARLADLVREYKEGPAPVPLEGITKVLRAVNKYERELLEERDAETLLESAESGRSLVKYVDKAMFDAEAFDREAVERPRVYLLSATPDPLGAIAAFAMMYEGRVVRDLSEITDDERRSYWSDCFKTALQTPLEAFDLHFMVEGLTRASWDQMTRQRTATFAGESLRFAVKEPLTDAVRPGPLVKGDAEREQIWSEAVESIESAYNRLIAAGVPAEDARGLLPLNVLVRGHWKTNFRNFYTEVGKRLCTQAQWEWRMIHAEVRNAIAGYGPAASQSYINGRHGRRFKSAAWQFEFIANSDVFKPICFQKGACMFKAKADRGCTIRERVDAGRFDAIKPEEWLLDPTAAWVR